MAGPLRRYSARGRVGRSEACKGAAGGRGSGGSYRSGNSGSGHRSGSSTAVIIATIVATTAATATAGVASVASATAPTNIAGAAPAPAAAPGPASSSLIESTLKAFEGWLILPSRTPVYAMLGTIAANLLPGDPVWLGIVAPPSSAKTELLNSVSSCHLWCRSRPLHWQACYRARHGVSS